MKSRAERILEDRIVGRLLNFLYLRPVIPCR